MSPVAEVTEDVFDLDLEVVLEPTGMGTDAEGGEVVARATGGVFTCGTVTGCGCTPTYGVGFCP